MTGPDTPAKAQNPLQAKLRAGIKLLRPRSWTKNLVCCIPLFCSGHTGDLGALINSALTFFAFCLGASFVYILNDLADVQLDREHPVKRFRPLAAGTLRRREAIVLALSLLTAACATAFAASWLVMWILLLYIALNLGYSLRLKHVAILDVMLISSGFILRLAAGGQASGIPISAWLLLCAFFLALFLAFSKRRAELNNSSNPNQSRLVLRQYTELMLDRFSNISATLAIASYSVFTVISRPDHALIITCPPVAFGMFRYLLLLETQHEGEAPELVLLQDRPLQIAILLWVATYTAVIYLGLRITVI